MKEVSKIKIEGASGFCHIAEAYNDSLVIEKNSIKYDYKPMQESEINPVRKWNYKTTSPLFEKLFNDVVTLLPTVINTDSEAVFCTDVGGYDFTVTYSDGSKWKDSFCTCGDTFAEFFNCIKRMIPESEYTPALLLTHEDFEDCDIEYDFDKKKPVDRIKEMEVLFKRAESVTRVMIQTLDIYKESLPEIRELEAYYTGDLWKKDFALDEAGKLPKNLERGVLSEDGLYNMLERNEEILAMLSKKW